MLSFKHDDKPDIEATEKEYTSKRGGSLSRLHKVLISITS